MPALPPIVVEGRAVPFQSDEEGKVNPETEWRKRIKLVVERHLRDNPTLKRMVEQVNSSRPFPQFSVEITLIMSIIDKADVDNLAKPIIDALFFAPPPKRKLEKPEERKKPTGILFSQIGDPYVYCLTICKRLPQVNEKEQAIIVISWT